MSSLKKLGASINRKKTVVRRPKSKLLVDSEMGRTKQQVTELDKKQMQFQHYLLQLQGFYNRHNPDKIESEAILILVEYALDYGVSKLNQKLTRKYGEDLRSYPGIIGATAHEAQIF